VYVVFAAVVPTVQHWLMHMLFLIHRILCTYALLLHTRYINYLIVQWVPQKGPITSIQRTQSSPVFIAMSETKS